MGKAQRVMGAFLKGLICPGLGEIGQCLQGFVEILEKC